MTSSMRFNSYEMFYDRTRTYFNILILKLTNDVYAVIILNIQIILTWRPSFALFKSERFIDLV